MTSPPEAVGAQFDLAIRENFPPRPNIAPTQPIAIIRRGDRRTREFALARWGFIPSWAKKDHQQRMKGRPLINARGETVADKPTFRAAFRRRRCLVPADGFYEWRTEDGARQPYLIEPAEGGVFALAGIWETAVDSDGGEIDTAAILTIAAGEELLALHDREPVVITRSNYDRWIDPDEKSAGDALALVAAQGPGFWRWRRAPRF